MLPADVYASAAEKADAHLQFAIRSVASGAGVARVTGPVVRVFRGSDQLRGTTATLAVPCDDPDDWAPDGLGRVPVASLRPGRVIEAFAQVTPDGYDVVLDLCQVIDAPTDTPRLTITGPGHP